MKQYTIEFENQNKQLSFIDATSKNTGNNSYDYKIFWKTSITNVQTKPYAKSTENIIKVSFVSMSGPIIGQELQKEILKLYLHRELIWCLKMSQNFYLIFTQEFPYQTTVLIQNKDMKHWKKREMKWKIKNDMVNSIVNTPRYYTEKQEKK